MVSSSPSQDPVGIRKAIFIHSGPCLSKVCSRCSSLRHKEAALTEAASAVRAPRLPLAALADAMAAAVAGCAAAAVLGSPVGFAWAEVPDRWAADVLGLSVITASWAAGWARAELDG